MSLYTDAIDAGLRTDHHESDLYVEWGHTTKELLFKHGARASLFVSQVDGRLLADIPFMFDPFWERFQRISDGQALLDASKEGKS